MKHSDETWGQFLGEWIPLIVMGGGLYAIAFAYRSEIMDLYVANIVPIIG